MPRPLDPFHRAKEDPTQSKTGQQLRQRQRCDLEDALKKGNVEQHQLQEDGEDDSANHEAIGKRANGDQ